MKTIGLQLRAVLISTAMLVGFVSTATPAMAAPAITNVSPTSGTYAGGTDITITGTGFAAGRTSVTIGGVAVTNLNVNVAGTEITARTPALPVGERDIVVTVTGDGAGTDNSTFTYVVLPPTTTSRLPASGPTIGGTTLVIYGTNLEVTTGVTIGGVAATIVGSPSSSSVTVTTPAGTAGEKVISLTSPGGTVSNLNFTYVAAPTVTGIDPATGLDTGGTAVTITGTNLLGATSVIIGGVAATSVFPTSPTTVTAVVPANTTGAKNVVVTTAGGSGTLTNGFTYTASLRILPATQGLFTYPAGVQITPTAIFEPTGFGGNPTYAINPQQPAGLSFNTATGVLSGTPTTNQPSTEYTITATRAGVDGSATAKITIKVDARITPPTQGPLSFTAGVAITPTTAFTPFGFTGSVRYALAPLSPALPAGLTLNETTGVISGIPTASQAATTHTITATGTTAGSTVGSGVATATISIAVGAAISPTTRTLNLTQNVAMIPTASYSLAGFSGTISYSISPVLPAGLIMNTTTGVISGIPAVVSALTNYTITVTGSGGGSANTTLTLAIYAPLAAPTGVAVIAGDTTATVSWNAVTGATGYQVVASPAAGVCTVTGTTATCTGLTNGTKYAFRVTAVNQAGAAALSTLSAQVTPKPPFVTKTGKLTITYTVTGTVVPAASLARIRAIGAQFKADKGTAAVISVKGFTTKGGTAIEKRLASSRAALVARALRQAGLRGTYTTTGDGETNRVGVKARKVVVKFTYTAPN